MNSCKKTDKLRAWIVIITPRLPRSACSDKFRFFGYYTEGGDNNNSSPEFVGFFTTIQNREVLEAHFLGYDESLNHSHQIYLNFLFDIIKNGIDNQSKSIVFARTAHEIKSSVGAKAHDMYLYMRHENPIINRLLPYFLKVLSPREDWQPRQPFKESEELGIRNCGSLQ